MDEYIYIKKSTLLIVSIIIFLVFAISIYFIISYYEKKSTDNVTVDIPTIVEDVNALNQNGLNIMIVEN